MTTPAERQRALRRAALAVTAELSLDSTLRRLVDAAKELGDSRYAALGVIHPSGRGLDRFLFSGVSEAVAAQIGRTPRGLGLLGAVLQERRPVRVARIADDPRAIGFPPGHPPMTSFLGVPILWQGRVLGNLYLADKAGAAGFSAEDEELLVELAAFAAVAIVNAQLHTDTAEALRRKVLEAETAQARLRLLVELSAMLPSGPIVEELPLAEALTSAAALLGDACALCLAAPDGTRTRQVVVHHDPARGKAAGELIAASWDVIRDQVIRHGGTIFIPDLDTVARPVVALDVEALRACRFSAVMVMPVRSPAEIFGAFASLASRPLRFSAEDLAFGSLFAERLGNALENARLLGELRDEVRHRDEFISIATHELKTPATVLMTSAEIARKHATDEQAQRALDLIARQAQRLGTLAAQLLDVSQLRAGRMPLEPERVDLMELARSVVERFRAQLGDEGPRLRLAGPSDVAPCRCDPLKIDQVFINLLSNAFKYSPDGGPVEVRVEPIGEFVRIAVADRGVGIPEGQQGSVFEPFFRASTAVKARATGAGLGLHISRRIIEQHEGRMWFESAEGRGSTFFFTLPLDRPPR